MTLTKLDSKGYSPRTIIIDNYDSYTFNLLQLLNNTENVIVIRNDQFSWTEFEQNILPHFDNIIISPGPGSPENSSDFGICSKILKLNNIPILGVCLGHQGIGYAFGGKIKNAEKIMHGRSSLIYHDGGDGDISLFSGIPNPFWAVRYHSLVVDNENLPSELIVSAWCFDENNLQKDHSFNQYSPPPSPSSSHSLEKSSKIMGLKHIKEPIYGVQFHPEAWFSICTEYGYKIIKNFNEITKKYHGKKQGLTFSRPKLPYNISALSVIPSNFFIFNPITRINNNKPKYYLVMKQFHENKWLDPYLVFKEIQQDSQNGFSFMGSTPNFSNTFSVSYSTLEKDLKIHCTNGKIISKKLEENQTFWDWMSNATRLINQNIGITKILKNNGLLYDILKLKKKEHLIIPFDFRLGMVGYFGYEMKCESMPGYVKVVPNGVGPNNKYQYLNTIEKAKSLIYEGQSYELCLTTQFHTKLPNKLKNIDDILELYYYIRSNNPAPYSAFIYFNNLSLSILSSSPEKFLEIDDKGVIEMKPIKGTVAKANKCFCEKKKTNETKDQYYDNKCDNEECCKIKRKEEDLRRIYMLKRNVKERAENLMIVDLIRNDLSQICIPNTVKVPYLMKVESYKSVHQLVTTVKGNLNRNIDYVNVIKNCFPPGSMTGAPKLRSVQLLEKLENYTPRGVYSGCLGYISLNEPNNPNNCGGGAHFSVVIRTVIIYDEKDISVGAGGAIIDLSNPETEWQEVLLKSQSVIPR
ncbi:9176_t:CDS:10 [Entrophospora sp. SA101]|nr:546_t:CDS:10 [Entrophospora sp. SA101]CAJ0844352.1 9176_t:CDS:10 [Entrophospora sp. SA101]